MSVQRISSFKTFTEVKNQQASLKMHEENKAKRAEIVSRIGAALEEMGVTSLQELDEEKRNALVAKIFNEDRAEDIEAAKVKMGQPKKHEDEEGKALQATNESEESVEIEEGNAFIYAAGKAKAEGKTEFEFNGKKYKVTLSTDTGLKESTMIITEGTRGFFGKIDKSGNIQAVYTHYDSYPEVMLPTIKKGYKNGKNVDTVLAKGDNSGLFADISKMNFYEDGNKPLAGKADKISNFIKDTTRSSAEYIYLFDERDGKWYMADTEEDKELKPAFEGLELEGEDLNEARSINKIQTEWSKVTAEMAAKAKDYKAAEGDDKAKVLDELKALTAKKKSLEAELDAAIADKDKDLELVVSESLEINEAKFKSGDFNKTLVVYKIDNKAKELYVTDVNTVLLAKKDGSSDAPKRFQGTFGMMLEDEWLKSFDKLPQKGDILPLPKAFESLEVNEDINIHDRTADLMNKLQVQIGNLLHAAKGNKEWTKELEAIKAAFEKLEDRLSIANKKLGLIPESVEITEGKYSKDQLLKLISDLDDAEIVVKGKTYIIYNPDNGNDDSAATWKKDTILATDADGDEHEFKYSDIQKFNESVEVNEADIKSDDEFKEYAFSVLKKAFGDEFDEAKAQEVVDGILAKSDGDYGSAVGMLTASLG